MAEIVALKSKREKVMELLEELFKGDESTKVIMKEELENLFSVLRNFPLEIEPLESDKRYFVLISNQKAVGSLLIGEDSLEYYFSMWGQNVSFRLNKVTGENGVNFVKNIIVDGQSRGCVSPESEINTVPEIASIIYEIKETIDERNQVIDQDFILKEADCDISSIEDEYLAEKRGELRVARYDAVTRYEDEILVHADCPRGFSNAVKVSPDAKLPKATLVYGEDYWPFGILSNLEFFAKKLLSCYEFKGFKVAAAVEDCEGQYVSLQKYNQDLALRDKKRLQSSNDELDCFDGVDNDDEEELE